VTSQAVVYLMGLVRTNEADAAANVASQVGDVRQVVTLFELID
jgi:osmotically-inducible protein OsmY